MNSDNNRSGLTTPPPVGIMADEISFYPADFRDIDEMVDNCWGRVRTELKRRGYGAEQAKIHLAIAEAVINAWKHGNHCQPDQPIVFRWRFNHQFTFEVLDYGAGFDPHQLPDPIEGPRLTAENGRGIFIIRCLARSVGWRDRGRRLIVTFNAP